jgi:hypothetical protein
VFAMMVKRMKALNLASSIMFKKATTNPFL